MTRRQLYEWSVSVAVALWSAAVGFVSEVLTSVYSPSHIVFTDRVRYNSKPWLFVVDYPRSISINSTKSSDAIGDSAESLDD